MTAINPDSVIFWYRRDLRLEDNCGLYHALRDHDKVIPVFIYDDNILNELPADDKRVSFIYETVKHLKNKLESAGGTLITFKGDPVNVFRSLKPGAVYTNHDYEPYAIKRDQKIASLLKKKGISFKTFKDQVIFEKDDILKDNGEPYIVYTPYSKRWKHKFSESSVSTYKSEDHLTGLLKTSPAPYPDISKLGFRKVDQNLRGSVIDLTVIRNYEKNRDYPAREGTTRLSVHLRFGTVSIRTLAGIALKNSESWLNELIWREFFMMILWHYPEVVHKSFKGKYDNIRWRNNKDEFEAWCQGVTGYPIVDAGMRQLNETGFMHNRLRMITAGFLTKHLLIDWRWGESYFGEKLLDYELSSNNGGWQWAAGSGCDAAPYFRIFNPEQQTKKYDPDHTFIQKWVPEYQSSTYPDPIVDHKLARQRALEEYKKALN